MIVATNDKENQISTLREGLSTLPEGSLLEMNSFKILELFFEQDSNVYIQTFIDSFFSKIDMRSFVKEYNSSINMLLGANLSRGNMEFKDVKNLFLKPDVYSMDNLNGVNFFSRLGNIPSINLTNNNFRGNEWDFTYFLGQLYIILAKYIEDKYDSDINSYPSDNDFDINLKRCMIIDLANILDKLIPNLKNTGLKIKYKPPFVDSKVKFNLLEFILRSGKFDGCYLDVSVTNNDEKIVITDDLAFYSDEYFNLKVVGGVRELKRTNLNV